MDDLKLTTEFKVDLIHRRTLLIESRTWYYREISQNPIATEGEVTSFDGLFGYHLSKTLARSPIESKLPLNVPYRLTVKPGDQSTLLHHSIRRLAGLPCTGTDASLPAIVNASDARITGERTLDGHQCVDISATIGILRIEASLDPSVSWLPRHLAAFRIVWSSSTPTFEQKTSEFQRFSTGVTNEWVWFPVRIHQIQTEFSTFDVQLNSMRFNTQMQESDFQVSPETLPPGVQVQTPDGTTYTGDRKDLWDEIEQLMSEDTAIMDTMIKQWREANPEPTTMPVVVDPTRDAGWNATVFGIAVLIVLFVGVQLALKRM